MRVMSQKHASVYFLSWRQQAFVLGDISLYFAKGTYEERHDDILRLGFIGPDRNTVVESLQNLLVDS